MTSDSVETGRGTVVVTGVSSGIGRATAEVLLARGYHVFGSVRSQADADRMVHEIGEQRFTPLLFDVTDEAGIAAAAEVVARALGRRTLTALVNSAGIALSGPLLHQSASEFAKHFEVNVIGPFLVTRAFTPLLGADSARAGSRGKIIMVSSISGGLATPFLGAYAASKHALEGYADALRRELMMHGIDVVVVGPGAVRTAIWDKAEKTDADVYSATPYAAAFAGFRNYVITGGRQGLPATHVGEVIAAIIAAKRPRARYAVLKGRFANWTLPRLMPRRVLDRILAKRMGLIPG